MNRVEVIRGDTRKITFTVTDENGDVVDLTGATAVFTVKKHLNDAVALIEKSTSVHVDTGAGITAFGLDSNDTSLPSRSYFYDLQIMKDGDVKSIPYGILRIKRDVTTLVS